jgi:hypothetical protein
MHHYKQIKLNDVGALTNWFYLVCLKRNDDATDVKNNGINAKLRWQGLLF